MRRRFSNWLFGLFEYDVNVLISERLIKQYNMLMARGMIEHKPGAYPDGKGKGGIIWSDEITPSEEQIRIRDRARKWIEAQSPVDY
jgi:hypothetical protein